MPSDAAMDRVALAWGRATRMAAGTATWGPSQLADDSFATVAPLQMSDISGMAAGRREGDGHGGLELSSRGGFVPFRDEAEGERV